MKKDGDKKPGIDPDLLPVAIFHVAAVLILLGVVWSMFGVLWAAIGLVLASAYWVYWINEQKSRAEARKITQALALKRNDAFQAPPPELLTGEPPTREIPTQQEYYDGD